MSEGGKPKNQEVAFKRMLLERTKVLDAKPGQVILVALERSVFADREQMQIAQMFAEQLGKAAKRDVFLVPEDTIHVRDDPRPQRLQVPRPQILLPSGVKLDG